MRFARILPHQCELSRDLVEKSLALCGFLVTRCAKIAVEHLAGGGQPGGATATGTHKMGDALHRANVELLLHDGPDLAPEILRRRLVVEGTCAAAIDADSIVRYLEGLSNVCAMNVLLPPVTHRSDRYGWAGWVHWEASGAHFYAWEQPLLFFSVDIYACAPF